MEEKVYAYCERGSDPTFWAEPFNAATNLSFIIAALLGVFTLLRVPAEHRSWDHWLLIFLVALIGIGSFAFHTLATRAAGLADVIPISVFMLIYLGFALNRFLDAPPGWTVLLVGIFAAVCFAAMRVECTGGAVSFAPAIEGAAEGAKCLNGSVGYLPALFAVFGVGIIMRMTLHPAANYVLWAGAVFLVSLTFRTLDRELCETITFDERAVGTHFIWHVLNAVVLFLLLRASFKAGSRVKRDLPGRAGFA